MQCSKSEMACRAACWLYTGKPPAFPAASQVVCCDLALFKVMHPDEQANIAKNIYMYCIYVCASLKSKSGLCRDFLDGSL